MRNQGQILLGLAALVIGLVLLLGVWLEVDAGDLCWPTAFILAGLWLLIRPWMVPANTTLETRLFGPLRRQGSWQVAPLESWLFVGDVDLDFTEAEIPRGETAIHCLGFVGTTHVLVPEGVGWSVTSTAFLTDAKVLGQKRSAFFVPVTMTSEDYATAERKIRLEVTYFVADVKIKQL